ncbi:MAG TPA: hypothetical protein VMY37_16320 [Thermoguttaceae bacterium]|nr:hypothetical protein [Thermoguttaceae bacterium]
MAKPKIPIVEVTGDFSQITGGAPLRNAWLVYRLDEQPRPQWNPDVWSRSKRGATTEALALALRRYKVFIAHIVPPEGK